MDLNSVYVPLICTQLWGEHFDSTYPIQLMGIINHDEYQESIQRINRIFSSMKIRWVIYLTIVSLMFGVSIIFTCIVGNLENIAHESIGYVLMYIGLVMFIGSGIFTAVGPFIIIKINDIRLRQAIANESIKYSSRSPTACSWRLHKFERLVDDKSVYERIVHIVICIGQSTPPPAYDNRMHHSNRVAPESVLSFETRKTFN